MSLKKQIQKSKDLCKVTFSLPKSAAHQAKDVKILGDFNNWDRKKAIKMKLSKKGDFTATIELKTGRDYQFRYLVNGWIWENDWAADGYVPSPYFGINNSVVSLPATKEKKKAATKKTTKKAKTASTKKTAPAKKTVTKKATPKKKTATAKKTTAKKTPVAKKATRTKAKVVKSIKDDLKKIEGVGPKIEGLLNAAGIKTWTDLSKARTTKLKQILEAAGSRYRMHNPGTWPTQAKLAAKGAWTALKKLQDELSGGKK